MDINFATMGAGLLHFSSMQQLPFMLKQTCPGFAEQQAAAAAAAAGRALPDPAASITGGSVMTSMTATCKLLEHFPGPLGPSTSKDKVTKFIKDRLLHLQVDECLTDAPSWAVDCRKALWELLLIMAKNQGHLKVSSSSGSSKAAAAVGGLLRTAVGAAANADGTGTGSGTGTNSPAAVGSPTAATAAAAAAAGQSELLRILAPDAASPAAAGQRLLAAQVQEMELQATAAEMQVRECTAQ
jgi:hypothetical protein